MYELVISCWLLATAVAIIKLLILAIQPQTTNRGTHAQTHVTDISIRGRSHMARQILQLYAFHLTWINVQCGSAEKSIWIFFKPSHIFCCNLKVFVF